jgi:catechol 2,3-dioxygenase
LWQNKQTLIKIKDGPMAAKTIVKMVRYICNCYPNNINNKIYKMNALYTIPSQTSIGHVHLKVSNLKKAMEFYCNLLGFEITSMYGDQAAFISAGGYHHHIGLNTWYSKNAEPAPVQAPGLFHTAILYPTRKDLAIIYKRIIDAGYPFTGFADHGVSEALYLNDPDVNGVELYWDKPKELWPINNDGTLHMYTKELDLNGLLQEIE